MYINLFAHKICSSFKNFKQRNRKPERPMVATFGSRLLKHLEPALIRYLMERK